MKFLLTCCLFMIMISLQAQTITLKTQVLDAIDESPARLNELLIYNLEDDTVAFYKKGFEADTFSMNLEVDKKYVFFSQGASYVTSIRKDTIKIQEADSVFNVYVLTGLCTVGFGGVCFYEEKYEFTDEDLTTIKNFNFGIEDLQQDYFLAISIRNKEDKKFQKILKQLLQMLDKKPDKIRYHTELHPQEKSECITFVMLIKHDENRKEFDKMKARFGID